ncbi:hypothetical protein F2Q70_00027046 [Brassica cretica]|uniref:AMP-dependent synthetase/ligase domain-containing protein n=1 Tax=Brassica cretica TaxID=69181 RepID=A0A8S9L3K9_BRACR|nr:hypothetical protein F2Q70_00027046 [Brassica cretica]
MNYSVGKSINPDDTAAIMYTSGTTGNPKGVMLTHRNLLHQIKHLSAYVPAEAGDRFLSMLPSWHAYERACEYFIFTCGVEQMYTSIRFLKDDLKRYQPHYLISVPLVYETLYSGIQKQISTSSAARKYLALTLIKISLAYMEMKRIYERWYERFFYVRIDGASVEENCLPFFRGKWNFDHANSILSATPRDLFAKRDLLRNGPFFWDSFTLDRIRNAVALYRSRGISRPLCASDMDEPHPDAVPDQRERVRPRRDKGIALEDRNFVSEDLPLPGWNPNPGFTPGDGSGTSEAPLPNDFFANLPPGFTTPASLDEASRREVVAEGSRLINEV